MAEVPGAAEVAVDLVVSAADRLGAAARAAVGEIRSGGKEN